MEIKKDAKVAGYDKYELESCVDCLVRAEEIKADKKKMAALKPMLEKKLKGYKSALSSLEDIKAYTASKAEVEMDEEEESES